MTTTLHSLLDLTPHAGASAHLLTDPGALVLSFRGDPHYYTLLREAVEVTGYAAELLDVAGLEAEVWWPTGMLGPGAEVWDDGEGDAPAHQLPAPGAPVCYRVTRAWYDDAGPDMGSVELAAWVDAWKHDLAAVIHEHLADRACHVAEMRAEGL